MNSIHFLFTLHYSLQEEYTIVLGTIYIYTKEININF